jgi:hypothetical protein
MIIIGTPNDLDNYFMADGDLIWELERAGFRAKYMDEDVQYFKLNNKLRKYLVKLGIKV